MSGTREKDEPSVSPASPPPVIPDMELLRRIGRGGFGEVWLARNLTTGGLRAVKVVPLRGTTSADPAGREIVSLSCLEQTARVRDPNLVTIHHVGRTAEHLFYIMDPADDVSGGPAACDEAYTPATLAGRLAAGPVSNDDCVRWTSQLLSALACLHREGLVHRDVKPANCLFIAGELKLADFGLLAQSDRGVSRVGTLAYMPPDGIMDARADVYAAGLVIYEMITGCPAHRFPSLQSRARAILADGRLTVLNRLTIKACQLDRDARYPDAVDMLQASQQARLERTAAGRPAAAGTQAGKSRGAVRRVIAALCLAAVLVVGWKVWDGHTSPSQVDVNFITDQWDAEIWLDGRQLCQPDGRPWLTPCTVPGLPPGSHTVVLKLQGQEDLDLGSVDFGKTREVTASWARVGDAPARRP